MILGELVRRLKKSAPLIGLALLAFIALGVVGFALMRQTGPNAQEISQFNEELKRKDAADAQSALDSTQTRISFPSGRPLNVLFVGDSITYGLYASTPEARWTALVAADLSKHGQVTTSYSAAPGRTVVDALAKPTPAAQDMTFVLLGNNDISKLDADTFKAKYQELLARLRAESPNGKLVCVSPYAALSFGPEFVAAEQAACKAMDARYVDIRTLTSSAENRSVVGTPWFEGVAKDTSHPSDAGHKAISEAILNTLIVN